MAENMISSTYPHPTPPSTEESRFAWLRLLRSRRIGPATFFRLLNTHGSAEAALKALPEVAHAAGVTGYAACPAGVVAAELKAARAAGARMLCLGAPDYPAALSRLQDAPPVIWARGDISVFSRPAIGLVGARNASSLGTRMARALARELGEAGFVVVSGMARGVDTAAHTGALETGTIAVFAGGVDVVYPAANDELCTKVLQNGACLSEQPMGVNPQSRHFPRRNRLIPGLARGVVLVEAAARSGSLITARDALDQGCEVMAVPGHPFDSRAAGCNMMIRDGAHLIRNADDVIEAIGPATRKPAATVTQMVARPAAPVAQVRPADAADPRMTQMIGAARAAVPQGTHRPARPAADGDLRRVSALHRQILDRLSAAPLAEDQLIRDVGADAREVGPALVDLEIDGRIERRAGGLLCRN